MATARCAECDAPLQPHSSFCASCGALVPRNPRKRARAESATTQTDVPESPPVAAPVVERVELAFSSGQRVVVSGVVVVGRKPADAARQLGLRSVEVVDDTKSVSRVHLYLEVVDGVVVLADAGSANGVRLEHAGQLYTVDPAGTRAAAAVGDTVWLGDLSFVIRPAAPGAA